MTLIEGYKNFAISSQLYSPEEIGHIPNNVIREKIKRYFERQPGWLLVYDNADRYEEIQDFLPQSGGHVLATSRSRFWPEGSMIDIEEMTIKEAREQYQQIRNGDDPEILIDLLVSETLGRLPLAIAQAAAYIKANEENISEYLELYSNCAKDLLEDGTMPADSQHQPVTLTWKITVNKIKMAYPDALLLQQACAFMESKDIPEKFLKEYFNGKGINEIRYNKIRQALVDYSLLKLYTEPNTKQKTLSVHPLVQSVTRWEMTDLERHKYLENLGLFCSSQLSSDPYEILKKQAALFRHFDQILKHITREKINKESMLSILIKGAKVHIALLTHKNLEQAIFYLKFGLGIIESLAIIENGEVADILARLGVAYHESQGETNIKLAIDYQNRSLTIRERIFGNESAEAAHSLNNLGLSYLRLEGENNIDLALAHHIKALDIRTKIHGEGSIETANSLNNLGITYSAKNNADASISISYHNQALEIRRKFLEKEHKDIAISLNNLGISYCDLQDKDNIERGIACYKESLSIFEKSLGEEHPYTLDLSNNLGVAYRNCDGEINLNISIAHHKKSLAAQKKVLGEKHLEVAKSLNNLAIAYQYLGGSENMKKAQGYAEEALAIQKKLLRDNHPDLAITMYHLALSYIENDALTMGLPMFRDAFSLFRKEKILNKSDVVTIKKTLPRFEATLSGVEHEDAIALRKELGKFVIWMSASETESLPIIGVARIHGTSMKISGISNLAMTVWKPSNIGASVEALIAQREHEARQLEAQRLRPETANPETSKPTLGLLK